MIRVIFMPFLEAKRRYSLTRSRPGSTTMACPAVPQPMRYDRQPESSFRNCWKIMAGPPAPPDGRVVHCPVLSRRESSCPRGLQLPQERQALRVEPGLTRGEAVA